ncbi:hypothetical protein [Cupriavidus campinensis]|uniref:hypothetical protein n=1 Tax=Cupriavidus campinensis TaxID=151783 RepID=UPI0024E25554|nr:hypothetical protein [Cupriavidus campinensis]
MSNEKNNEAASVAQGMSLPQMEMLRALLVSIRPEYGTPGSRDVDIGRQQKRIDAAPPATSAARDVLAERQRQIGAEGWTPEHDDEHIPGTLSQAAGCYIEWNGYEQSVVPEGAIPINWPWAADWWKPKDERRNLVRAGALILAEIERLDRAARNSSACAENTPLIAANPAEIAPGTLPYPTEPTDALLEVLGLMLYTTTPIAHALRAAGTAIPKRCEEEQAYVLHWLIQLALRHGAEWRARAAKSIEEVMAATRRTDWNGEPGALKQGDA